MGKVHPRSANQTDPLDRLLRVPTCPGHRSSQEPQVILQAAATRHLHTHNGSVARAHLSHTGAQEPWSPAVLEKGQGSTVGVRPWTLLPRWPWREELCLELPASTGSALLVHEEGSAEMGREPRDVRGGGRCLHSQAPGQQLVQPTWVGGRA